MKRLYYTVKPLVPRRVQVAVRGWVARRQRAASTAYWPILDRAGQPPMGWGGWPPGKRFALVLLHDVETARGQERCRQLMDLEEALGVRSSLNVIPERYALDAGLRREIVARGFELGVHGLHHDGRLFQSRAIFRERAAGINAYLREWRSVGFCSPASHHNLEWTHDLDILHDSSTFDTDPFEPQPDGCETIYPFVVVDPERRRGYVELPYTLPQDFTLFVLLRERTNQIWRRKLAWIAARGGMALLITHPDYMGIGRARPGFEEYPVTLYEDFLRHALQEYGSQCWQALPRDVASWVAQQREPASAPLPDRSLILSVPGLGPLAQAQRPPLPRGTT